ncbi:MAG: VCBS repeat-containing protein [Desulfosarcinaceae bacterium]
MSMIRLSALAILLSCLVIGCGGGTGSSAGGDSAVESSGSSTGGLTNPVCTAGTGAGEVQAPVFVRNLGGQTGWFASPVVADLDGDGSNELIAAYYDLYVFDARGQLLDQVHGNGSRIYAPHVVTDLEGDGIYDIVCGQGRAVYAYEWRSGALRLKAGWPADTTTAGEPPEVRGLAAADLDGNGLIEVVATTTQTQPTEDGGAQVFVFSPDGRLYQPAGLSFPAWPRYNSLTGPGGDADRNGMGNSGYGCYGLNVGIGNIDDDPQLEIIVTYDNHAIQAFNHDGTSIDAAPYFTNPASNYNGLPLTWGQFIRWADPLVEEDHYHLHTGEWPNPGNGQAWLQWTASPPNVVDLNGDGRNEVVGVPNVEKDIPYVTQAYAVMALEGAYGDGSRSAMRLAGWEILPRGAAPVDVDGWYPPSGVPAPATIDIQDDARPEIMVSLNDGCMHAFDAEAHELWRYNYTHGKAIMFSSEAAVADLNQDGSPEVIFSTYGDPDVRDSGRLVILAANGALLHDVPLPDPGHDGNGNGAPAAPTVADLDGDGQLEILVQTFDHGLDIFTVPGSGCDCLLWSTARGGPLRMGAPNGN